MQPGTRFHASLLQFAMLFSFPLHKFFFFFYYYYIIGHSRKVTVERNRILSMKIVSFLFQTCLTDGTFHIHLPYENNAKALFSMPTESEHPLRALWICGVIPVTLELSHNSKDGKFPSPCI